MEFRPSIAGAEKYINKHKFASVLALGIGAVAAGQIIPEGGEKVFSRQCVYRTEPNQNIRTHYYTRTEGHNMMARRNDYLGNGYSVHSIINGTKGTPGYIHEWIEHNGRVLGANKMPVAYNGLEEFFNVRRPNLRCEEKYISEKDFEVPAKIGFTEVQEKPMNRYYTFVRRK